MEHLCKKCGKVIVPAVTEKGKEVNLDAATPCYLNKGFDGDRVIIQLEPEAFVDHDLICKNREASLEESFGG